MMCHHLDMTLISLKNASAPGGKDPKCTRMLITYKTMMGLHYREYRIAIEDTIFGENIGGIIFSFIDAPITSERKFSRIVTGILARYNRRMNCSEFRDLNYVRKQFICQWRKQ